MFYVDEHVFYVRKYMFYVGGHVFHVREQVFYVGRHMYHTDKHVFYIGGHVFLLPGSTLCRGVADTMVGLGIPRLAQGVRKFDDVENVEKFSPSRLVRSLCHL